MRQLSTLFAILFYIFYWLSSLQQYMWPNLMMVESILETASHNYCHLLCHLYVILKVIFANSVDPDQTAPVGAVWSGSTLFACRQK